MKPLKVLTNALQDIIQETFQPDKHDLKSIREIAQNALNNYKKKIPKPRFSCPKNFVVGEDYNKFPGCGSCAKEYSQVCGIYNYVWYKEV